MCGIIGYVGKKDALPVVVDGLKRLEYRGYDSAGLAVLCDSNKSRVFKVKGNIKALKQKVKRTTVE